MLRKWKDLPAFMRTKEVRPYYDVLRKHQIALLMKRTFDFVMSTFLLLLLSPVFLVLAIWIKLDSPGTVFYRQERITQYGRHFRIYKFRTMVQGADKIGSLVTTRNDSRITKAGHKLRGYRLDELPQLINIWKGEMSFVGTRPEVEKYVKCYTNEMYATLLLPAGVTSKASVQYKDENRLLTDILNLNVDFIYVHQILPNKMKINLSVISNFSLFGEISTLFETIYAVIR